MSSLFRHEVIEGRRQGWLGSIQLIRPVSLAVLTCLVVMTALFLAAYLSTGQYTRKARVAGYLVPDRGVLRLEPPQAGTVLQSHVVEGQSVRRDEVLFVLSLERATLGGDTQAAVQASLEARERSLMAASRQMRELQQAQAAGLDRQIADMRRELAQMGMEAELQAQRLALAQQALARLESLRADHFISAAQVQSKAEELLGLRAQMQALERQRAAQSREIGVLEAQRHELPLREMSRQGEIERDLATLAQASAENEARRHIVLRAPQDGTVTAVTAQVGQPVSPSTALASLLPSDARLQAHLFAPSSAVGFLRREQPVLLRYEAFPYQKFGHQPGRVLQVSRTPLQASDLAGVPLPAAVRGEALYRITVDLERQAVQAYGVSQGLSSGMQLEADVLLDRRRLIEWLFEPVLSVAGRI